MNIKLISEINKIKDLVIFLLFICNIFAFARYKQEEIKFKSDTVCYKLNFQKGDTLIFQVESNDSIIINLSSPLLKKRHEKLQITCDSITPYGTFILRQKLIDFHSYERNEKGKEIQRKYTPWMNRVAIIEIDSLCNRISLTLEDTTIAGICPGGAFQPYILFPFAESCKRIGESWIVEKTDILVENGLPVPLLKYTSFFRAKGIVDTLEEKCLRFEYIKTGQGSYELQMTKDTLLVTNVINGYGQYHISSKNLIPIHYFATVEQKLTLHLPNGQKQPGLHFISSNFSLIKFIRKIK